jgi:hypothetical protein
LEGVEAEGWQEDKILSSDVESRAPEAIIREENIKGETGRGEASKILSPNLSGIVFDTSPKALPLTSEERLEISQETNPLQEELQKTVPSFSEIGMRGLRSAEPMMLTGTTKFIADDWYRDYEPYIFPIDRNILANIRLVGIQEKSCSQNQPIGPPKINPECGSKFCEEKLLAQGPVKSLLNSRNKDRSLSSAYG